MKRAGRIIAALLPLVLIGLSLMGCASSNTASSKQEDKTVDPAGRKVLLEVSTEASKTVYPPGETLDLRLYETGEAEYDYYTPPNPSKVGEPFKAVRRQARLSTEEVERVRNILNEPTLSDSKAEYLPTKPILDSSVVKVVVYNNQGRERRIVLKENDSHLLLDRKGGVYPAPLIELLKLVQKINEDLRRKNM